MSSFFDSVSDAISYMRNYSRTNDYKSLDCEGGIGYYTTIQVFCLPASLLIILYAFTIKRKLLWPEKLGGRPALVYPMSMLTQSESVSYAACFGVIASFIWKIIFESKQAIEYEGPAVYKTFVTILSMFIYGIICFPIFAGIAMRTALAYGLGTLYTWIFTVLITYSYYTCDLDTQGRVAYLFQSGPQNICLWYLSIRFPYGFYIELKRWRNSGSCEKVKTKHSMTLLRESYQGQHVTSLFKKPEETKKVGETILEKISIGINNLFHNWVYHWQPHFRYSSRFLSIMWVGFVILYMTAYKTIWNFTQAFLYLSDTSLYALNGIGWDDQAGDTDVKKMTRLILKVSYYGLAALWLLIVVCLLAAFITGTASILYSLTAYRQNLRDLYRGNNRHIPARQALTNIKLLMGSMKYTGYQIGYIAWAFVLQSLCFFIIIILLLLVIAILLIGFSSWLTGALETLGPWVLVLLLVFILQYLMVRFTFLQDHETSLSIDNRRLLYIVTYFLLFYNVFIGITSCLLRLAKALCLGLLFIPRLDHSILPRKFELSDAGFERYIGFIHVECYHTHPCMFVFVNLLKLAHLESRRKFSSTSSSSTPDVNGNEEKEEKKPSRIIQNKIMTILGWGEKRNNKVGSGTVKQSAGNIEDVEAINTDDQWDSGKAKASELISSVNHQMSLEDTKGIVHGNTTISKVQVTEVESQSDLAAKDAVVIIEDSSNEIDHWEEGKDSPAMKVYRRRQKAAFNWFLAYTLMNNPQFQIERRGFIQKRMREPTGINLQDKSEDRNTTGKDGVESEKKKLERDVRRSKEN